MTSSNHLSPSLRPLPDSARDRRELVTHRLTLAAGAADQEAAATILEESLRAGLWRYSQLWLGFENLPRLGADYPRLKRLWLDSPKGCRTMRAAITVVARAAALHGEHGEARLLMRKALVLTGAHRQRLGNRLRRAVRIPPRETRVPPPVLPPDDDAAAETTRYFALYEALALPGSGESTALIAELRQHGEGEWLGRL